MDRFHLLTVFVAVAEEESFAGAARRLKISPPATTRAISALEARLGVRLLTRTTRVVKVTEAGARYLDDARRIIADWDEADAAASGNNATPRGQLAVTAPVMFGKLYVMPIIASYRSKYEETTVSALFVDRIVNLFDEGLDVGIRIGELPESPLRAIRVGHVRRVVVVAPSYLNRHGVPATPKELQAHRIISATSLSPNSDWRFGSAADEMTVRIRPAIQVNTNDGALEAARQGFGLTRVLSYQVAAELVSGELATILDPFSGPELPIHVIHREGRYGSAKVRSFVDLAVEHLRADHALN